MPSNAGWGALLGSFAEGASGYRSNKQKQQEELANAAMSELANKLALDKFQLEKDKFEWDKTQDDLKWEEKAKKKTGGIGPKVESPTTTWDRAIDKDRMVTKPNKDVLRESVMAEWQSRAKAMGRELTYEEKKTIANAIAKPYGMTWMDLKTD